MNENKSKWIPVGEKIPFFGQKIIATLQSKGETIVTIIKYDGINMAEGCRLTAWMPAPAPFMSDITRMYMVICMYLRNGSGIAEKKAGTLRNKAIIDVLYSTGVRI